MNEFQYYKFDVTKPAIIKLSRRIDELYKAQAQEELICCLRQFFCWKLPELMKRYPTSKNTNGVIHSSLFAQLNNNAIVSVVIKDTLFHFVTIPLKDIQNQLSSDFIMDQLTPHLQDEEMSLLGQNLQTLQALDNVNNEMDVASYLFRYDLTAQDLRALRRPSDQSRMAARALEHGFFESRYHNLLADVGMPSPAQMMIQRLLGLVNLPTPLPSSFKFYANFTCLVQGSGSGKSRLAAQCSQRFYEVFLCLRPENSSGYPPRSLLATPLLQLAETITDENDGNARFERFFAAVFHVIATYDWDALRTTNGIVSPATFWEYTMVTHATSFAETVLTVYNDWNERGVQPDSVNSLMRSALDNLNPQQNQHVGPFLVVLDEARALLRACKQIPGEPTLFVHWRCWLANSGTWRKSFFLLLDTTSRVTNFYPSRAEHDPSARIARLGYKLLRPIFEFPFLGPWPLPGALRKVLQPMHSADHTRVPPSVWPTSVFQPLDHLFRFSRPMYLHVGRSPTSKHSGELMDEVIGLVRTKLFSDDPKSKLDATVAVCYRYGLRPYQLTLQDTLLGSHGATLVAIGLDNALDVRYLPEPIVGEALCHWQPPGGIDIPLSQHKLLVLLDCLKSELHGRQLIRGLRKGDRGELAASVYLLHAYEEATRRAASTGDGKRRKMSAASVEATESSTMYQTFSGLLRVQDWIAAMAGAPFRSTAITDRLSRVMQSAVSFTGWTVADEPIIPSMVRYAWCHRVGYLCNEDEPVTDLVLPSVRRRSNSTDTKLDRREGQNRSVKDTIHVIASPQAMRATAGTCTRASAAESAETMMGGGGPIIFEDEDQMDTKCAMADLAQAKQQGFLPIDRTGLGVVAIQVKNTANDIHLGEAFHYCRLQAARLGQTAEAREDVLSVLCMTGTGRVTSRYFPHDAPPTVLVFVDVDPTSSFVGLIVNGFNEQLVGASAKAALETLSTHVRITMEKMYQEEQMDSALATQYALIARQQAARLPGDFHVGPYEAPAAEHNETPVATASVSKSKQGKTRAVAVVTTATNQPLSWTPLRSATATGTSKAPSGTPTVSPAPGRGKGGGKADVSTRLDLPSTPPMAEGKAISTLQYQNAEPMTAAYGKPGIYTMGSKDAPRPKQGKTRAVASKTVVSQPVEYTRETVAAPPLDPPFVKWTHRDIPVTWEGIERLIRVYWFA